MTSPESLDTMNRAMLLHQKMTEAGFTLTEVEEMPAASPGFWFRVPGPTFHGSSINRAAFRHDPGSWAARNPYKPPEVTVLPRLATVTSRPHQGNQTSVFNEGIPSAMTGHLATQTRSFFDALKARRAEATEVLGRLATMTKFLGDTEHDWPKRNSFALLQPGGRWLCQNDRGVLDSVPPDLVLDTRDLMDRYPAPHEGELHHRTTFLDEVAWSREILALELPAIPKVPRKFRSFAVSLNSFTWEARP